MKLSFQHWLLIFVVIAGELGCITPLSIMMSGTILQDGKVMTAKEQVENLTGFCNEEEFYRNRCEEQCDFCKELETL